MTPVHPASSGTRGGADATQRRRAIALSGFISGAVVAGVALTACVLVHVRPGSVDRCPFAVVEGSRPWLGAVMRAAVVGVLFGAMGTAAGLLAARERARHLVDRRGRQ